MWSGAKPQHMRSRAGRLLILGDHEGRARSTTGTRSSHAGGRCSATPDSSSRPTSVLTARWSPRAPWRRGRRGAAAARAFAARGGSLEVHRSRSPACDARRCRCSTAGRAPDPAGGSPARGAGAGHSGPVRAAPSARAGPPGRRSRPRPGERTGRARASAAPSSAHGGDGRRSGPPARRRDPHGDRRRDRRRCAPRARRGAAPQVGRSPVAAIPGRPGRPAVGRATARAPRAACAPPRPGRPAAPRRAAARSAQGRARTDRRAGDTPVPACRAGPGPAPGAAARYRSGCSSPQLPAAPPPTGRPSRRSVETTSPACRIRIASSDRCLTPPRASERSPSTTSSGPRMRKYTSPRGSVASGCPPVCVSRLRARARPEAAAATRCRACGTTGPDGSPPSSR